MESGRSWFGEGDEVRGDECAEKEGEWLEVHGEVLGLKGRECEVE